jgi:translation initiation factor IF-1
MFTVLLNDDQDVKAGLSGRMRSRYTRLGAGDKVPVERSSSDRTRGRIVDRDRGEGDGDPGAPQRVLV